MIQSKTKLTVADNSGPSLIECIRILSGAKWGNIGDTMVLTIKKNTKNKKWKKGLVMKGLIVRTRRGIRRPNGTKITFNDNSVVLLNAQGNLIGNRIQGSIPKELRRWNHLKIMSLASSIC